MKAVIVDIDGKNAVALNKKGDFLKIKNNGNYQVGAEVEIPFSTLLNFNKISRIMPIAAAFLVFTSLGLGTYAYTKPYSYVDVDINPSIEITSNIFDRIIKVEGLNDDGKSLLGSVSYNNKDINDGINDILKAAENHGYIVSSTTSAVMFTVSGNNDAKVVKMEAEIQKNVDTEFKKSGTKADVIVDNVTLKGRDDARLKGISPGKLLLINRLIKVNPDAKVEDYKNATVKDIMKEINAEKGKQNEKPGKKINENAVKVPVDDKVDNEDKSPQNTDKINKQGNNKDSLKKGINENKSKKEIKVPVETQKKKEETIKQEKPKKNIEGNNKKKTDNKSDLKDRKRTRDRNLDDIKYKDNPKNDDQN